MTAAMSEEGKAGALNTLDTIVFEPAILERSLFSKVDNWIASRGEFSLPCLPALLDSYLTRVQNIFTLLGLFPCDEDFATLRQVLEKRLEEGFRASPFSKIRVEYETPNYPMGPVTTFSELRIHTVVATMEDKYKNWLHTRKPPFFGSHPDAKVIDCIVAEEQVKRSLTVLDVGAGTGRNSFPIARRGHQVHALEVTPDFADRMAQDAQSQSLPVRVIQGDIIDAKVELSTVTYDVVLVVEVISHFRTVDEVRSLFQRVSQILKPGGKLVCNTFLPVAGYQPDQLVREMSQFMWSSLFLREEIEGAINPLPFRLLSDELVYSYEKERLPEDAWPPTGWFENWSLGRNLFPVMDQRPPVELRWLLFEKVAIF